MSTIPIPGPQPGAAGASASTADASASPGTGAGTAIPTAPITLSDVKSAMKSAILEREQEVAAALKSEAAKLEAEASGAWTWIKDKLRASPLLVLFIIAFAVVYSLNPAKAGLAIWGVARVGLFAYLAYWVDRIIFGRLKGLSGIDLGTAWKRRAFIIGCALIAGALLP